MHEKKSVLCQFDRPPITEATKYWVALSTLLINADIGKVVKIDSQTRVLTVQHLLRKNGYEEFRFVEILIPFDHPDLVWSRLTDSIEIVGALPYEIIDAAILRSDTANKFAQQLITSFIDDIIIQSISEEAEKMEPDSVEVKDAAMLQSDVATKFASELITSFIDDVIQSRIEEAEKMKAERMAYNVKWSAVLVEVLLEEFGDEQLFDTANKAWNYAKTERDEFLSKSANYMTQFVLSEVLSDVVSELITGCLDAVAISGLVHYIISEIVESMKISPKLSTTSVISDLVPQQMRIVTTTDESKFEDDNSSVDSSVFVACYVDDKEEDSLNFVKERAVDFHRIISRSRRPVTLAGKETIDIVNN